MRLGRRARLVPVPPALLRTIVAMMPARLLGGLNREEMISELLDDFRLDVGPTRERLGWRPMRSSSSRVAYFILVISSTMYAGMWIG